MSAVVLQCSSFFRRGWCQGSGITASLWWETVAHLLGWLPSFGIIGEGREGGMGRGAGVYRMGALKTLWDSTICCGNDLHPFSPFSYNRAPSHTVSASLLFCSCAPPLSLSHSGSFHVVDQATIPRWTSWDPVPLVCCDYHPAISDCWFSHSLCCMLAQLPYHFCKPSFTRMFRQSKHTAAGDSRRGCWEHS